MKKATRNPRSPARTADAHPESRAGEARFNPVRPAASESAAAWVLAQVAEWGLAPDAAEDPALGLESDREPVWGVDRCACIFSGSTG